MSWTRKCGGCSCKEVDPIFAPSFPVVKLEVKKDRIKTAKEAIESVFSLFSKAKPECTASAEILDKLGFKELTELKDVEEIKEAFVSKVAEKLLEKFNDRVAIITEIDGAEPTVCVPKKGSKIKYLVAGADETADTSSVSEFGDSATDGVIEDLIGAIEVVQKPKVKLV